MVAKCAIIAGNVRRINAVNMPRRPDEYFPYPHLPTYLPTYLLMAGVALSSLVI